MSESADTAIVPAAAPTPPTFTLRDLAIKASTHANLNSFVAKAYPVNPDHAARLSDTFAKDCPDFTRIVNICDTGLVKQIGFYKSSNNELAVLSCPYPETHPTSKENLIAGTLGDAFDIICPVTIHMKDVKGHVISLAPSKTIANETYQLPTSTSDPLNEEGPPPADGTDPEQPGPERIHVEVTDPNVSPCFAMVPKVFPFSGGHSIPSVVGPDVDPPAAFTMWSAALQYGITNLQNKSIHDHDTLFDYDKIEKAAFEASDRALVSTFTVEVTYLTPDDPLYQAVVKNTRVEKERAVLAYGSASVPTTPPRHPTDATNPAPMFTSGSPTSVSDMSLMIEGLSKAITNSKSMTSTERERETEADEVVNFYQLLFASIHDVIQPDGTTKRTLVKAQLKPLFIKNVLKANKNSKATKAMQDLIDDTSATLSAQDNRFSAACNLLPHMFDQPLVAALRSGTWEHQHTVLHPDGIKTHFGIHHIAAPRTWSVLYKTRMEGEMLLVRQEQVEEDKSRLQAKTTDLYHMGKMGTLADINELFGNLYGLISTITIVDTDTRSAIWLEVLAFEKIMRTQEGRQWFDLHRNLREVPFNVVQDIQSTVAGFAAEARKPGYRAAIASGVQISPHIFNLAMQQGIELRRTLQTTILTMAAGHYNLVPLTYKFFHPDILSSKEKDIKKREASTPASDLNTTHHTRQRTSQSGSATTAPYRSASENGHRNPPASPAAQTQDVQALPGKTILKIVGEQNIKLPHPGPIFPHPTKPSQLTLMCCRSAYDGKSCPLKPCNFYHFPANLSSVPQRTKTKLQSWVTSQANIAWAPAAATWGASSTNSTGN